MRTTVELPDELMDRAKTKAQQEGLSLKEFFIEAVNLKLSPPLPRVRRPPPLASTGGRPIGDLTAEQRDDAMFGSIDENLFGGR